MKNGYFCLRYSTKLYKASFQRTICHLRLTRGNKKGLIKKGMLIKRKREKLWIHVCSISRLINCQHQVLPNDSFVIDVVWKKKVTPKATEMTLGSWSLMKAATWQTSTQYKFELSYPVFTLEKLINHLVADKRLVFLCIFRSIALCFDFS